jgi:hypothetical protein
LGDWTVFTKEATIPLLHLRIRAAKQGRLASSARPAVAFRLGIVALRWSISILKEDGVLRRPELRLISSSSQYMSMRIEFSGDPSPDEVVVLVYSFVVSPPSSSSSSSSSSSVTGRSEAVDGDR